MLGRNKKEEAAHDLGLEADKIAADAFPGMLSSHTHPFASQVMQDNGIKKSANDHRFAKGTVQGLQKARSSRSRSDIRRWRRVS
jgi:hypothetical protein